MSKSVIIGDKGHLPRAAKRKETTFERIHRYYYDSKVRVVLSKKEEKIRDRWERIWLLLTNLRTKQEIVRYLQKYYDVSDYTAYQDIKSAKQLFGDPEEQIKSADRAIINHTLLKAIRKAFAKEQWEQYERMVLRFEKINRLGENDTDAAFEILKNQRPSVIVFTTDEKTLRQEAEKLMSDVETVDIDHKEVDNDRDS